MDYAGGHIVLQTAAKPPLNRWLLSTAYIIIIIIIIIITKARIIVTLSRRNVAGALYSHRNVTQTRRNTYQRPIQRYHRPPPMTYRSATTQNVTDRQTTDRQTTHRTISATVSTVS